MGQDSDQEGSSVDPRAVVESLFAAFQRGDVAAVESTLADDCSVWDVFTPHLVAGAEERRAFHDADRAQSQARGPFTWSIRFVRVEEWGPLAMLCYYLDFSYADPGSMQGTVRCTDLLRQRSGAWQILHHHEGLVPETQD